MRIRMIKICVVVAVLLGMNLVSAAPGVNVVYPDWFKQSLNDLQGDLQDAKAENKRGIMVFFTEKHCSYCHAMIETTLNDKDIQQRLRKDYDVIGMDVFSDVEVVDTQGNSLWTKDFAVREKAVFTPTLIFYGLDGKVQLRLVGFQSVSKMSSALDYLEGGHFKRMSLGEFMADKQAASKTSTTGTKINLDRRDGADKQLLVVFESDDCSKCQLLRKMMTLAVMQPYTQRLKIVYINSSAKNISVVTPDGKTIDAAGWSKQLGLINRPAMVFFNEQGKEVLRVDTDILIDEMGQPVTVDNPRIQDNLRARLQFVVDKGYVTLPQFQRWRSQQGQE